LVAELKIDATDLAIVEELEEDARQTLSEIAAKVSLSAPAVKRRIDRLLELGVIAGYTVRVDHSKLGRPLVAFTELRFTGSTPVEEITEIAAATPEVEALFTIAGDPDAIVQVRVADVDQLNVVIDRFRRSGKVTGTKTLIVLGSWRRHGTQQL
jgi:Lrp/AsnC family transcriptional regulator, leucine-responsive regulatory protein